MQRETKNEGSVVFREKNREPHADLGQNSGTSFNVHMSTVARRQHGIV